MFKYTTKSKLKKSEGSALKLVEMKITYDQMNTNMLPAEVSRWIDQSHSEIFRFPKRAIRTLNGFLEKYPDHPVVLNWLATAYANNNQYEKALSLIMLNYEKNPDYLFGLCNYALNLLNTANYKVVPDLFNNMIWLGDLYPDREVFHISEVEIFYRVYGLYYIADRQFERAREVIDMMKSIDTDLKSIRVIEQKLEDASEQVAVQDSIKDSGKKGGFFRTWLLGE